MSLHIQPTLKLAIVSPCYNEEAVVELFVREVTATMENIAGVSYRLFLVDDGSSDGTLPAIRSLAKTDDRIVPVALSRNFGHQIALSAGIEAAGDVDALIVMDSDLQHPPALIERFLREFVEGHDVVMAVRQDTEGASWFKRFSSRAYYSLFNSLSEVKIQPGAADFYLLSAQALDALRRLPERRRFLRAMIHWIGYSRKYIEYVAPPRAAGESKYTLWKMLSFGVDGVLAFSSRPIRLASRVGLGVIAAGGAYLTYVLARAFLLGDLAAGWGSLMGVLLILGGVQLFFIGLIGEYISRIFEESKSRPLFLLQQERSKTFVLLNNGSSLSAENEDRDDKTTSK